MSPKVKICNKIRDFLPLDVLLPLNLHGILGEDREQKIRATKRNNRAWAKASNQTCLSPLKDMWHLSSWTPSIWDPWRLLSPWVFSPPRDMIKLWCDLSLPLWHQFPRRALLDMWYKWVGPWVTEQSSMSNMMLVEDKNHWVELEQTEIRNKWQVGFPVVESVTPSCVLWLHRKISVGPKRTNRCDRVH